MCTEYFEELVTAHQMVPMTIFFSNIYSRFLKRWRNIDTDDKSSVNTYDSKVFGIF